MEKIHTWKKFFSEHGKIIIMDLNYCSLYVFFILKYVHIKHEQKSNVYYFKFKPLKNLFLKIYMTMLIKRKEKKNRK